MEILEINPKLKELEAKQLERRYKEEQKKREQWERFKSTVYWKLITDEMDEWIDDYKDITKVLSSVSPSDFEELGKITAVRTEIYNGIKRLKQKLLNK